MKKLTIAVNVFLMSALLAPYAMGQTKAAASSGTFVLPIAERVQQTVNSHAVEQLTQDFFVACALGDEEKAKKIEETLSKKGIRATELRQEGTQATPLIVAAKYGKLNIVKWLAPQSRFASGEFGEAIPNASVQEQLVAYDKDNRTALEWATIMTQTDIVEYLLRFHRYFYNDMHVVQAAQRAAKYNNSDKREERRLARLLSDAESEKDWVQVEHYTGSRDMYTSWVPAEKVDDELKLGATYVVSVDEVKTYNKK